MGPLKYRMRIQYLPAKPCISSAESIPGELLLRRAYFRFNSNTKFKRKNYINKFSKKVTLTKPQKTLMDNGPEFGANVAKDWSEANEIEFKYNEPGKLMQNRYIERFNRTYREGVLDAY